MLSGMRKNTLDRFREKCVVNEDGCWLWMGSKFGTGYGQMRIGGKSTLAHLFSLREKGIAAPAGHHFHNICGHRDCVNPEHWRSVPQETERNGPFVESDEWMELMGRQER